MLGHKHSSDRPAVVIGVILIILLTLGATVWIALEALEESEGEGLRFRATSRHTAAAGSEAYPAMARVTSQARLPPA